MAIQSDGTLWATGEGYPGQLGLGDSTDRSVFTQVGTGTTWSKVVCGYTMTLALKTDGTLHGTGYNVYNNLGTGNSSYTTSFTQAGVATTWTDMSCGAAHSIGLRSDGTLWGVGYDRWGRLGFNSIGIVTTWTQIGVSTLWTAVKCGDAHSMALRSDGTLYGTGRNTYGQLGNGTTPDEGYFIQIGSDTLWEALDCGYWNTIARKSDSTLWGTGRNSYGQLGLNDTTDRSTLTQIGVTSDWGLIASGGAHTAIGINTITPPGQHRGVAGIDGGVLFNGNTIIGDRTNGKIYALDMNVYTDNGGEIKRVRRTQIVDDGMLFVLHQWIEIEFEAGVGLDVAAGVDGYDPQAELKWSDDGGETWSAGRSVSIGRYQQFVTRAVWRQLGKSRNRIYELTITDPVKVVLIGADTLEKACRA